MIGIHVSKNIVRTHNTNDPKKYKTMRDAVIKEKELLNMSACAFFTHGPMNKKRNHMDYQGIKKYCEENNIAIHTHGSYISVGIWNVNQKNRHENKSLMFIRHIKDLLVDGKQLKAKGVVLHVPRHPIETIVESMEIMSNCKVINSIRRNEGVLPKLTLETPASRPDDILTYETPEKLNTLMEALESNAAITIGWDLCLDTCHLWAGGIDFSNANMWNEYQSKMSVLSKEKLKLIHLNGAQAKNFRTGKDGHIVPLSKDDAIWGKYVSPEIRDYLDRTSIQEIASQNLFQKLSESEIENLKNSSLYDIIQYAKKNNISLIMEIKKDDFTNTKFAMDVINGFLL